MNVRKLIKKLLCLILIIILSACGTIIHGRSQDLSIVTRPSGAIAKVDDKQCTTPCSLKVSRKTTSVQISKDGHESTINVDRSLNGFSLFFDIVMGTFVFATIDTILGGLHNLEPVSVDLTSSMTTVPAVVATPVNAMSAAEGSAISANSDVDILPPAKTHHANNFHAIVIGIERYRQNLPRADFANHDAQTVTNYLTNVLGYPEENIITLLDDRALKSDFEKYFEKWLANNVEAGSTVFVYYSGHGAPDMKNGNAYLVPYDGDPMFIDQTGYSLIRMYDVLSKLPAKEIIIALDSCFSGAGGRSVIAKGERPLVMNLQRNVVLPENMTVLSASSGDQTSSTYDKKGHGLFTYFMLKGIKDEDVTRPDGSLKIDDLYGYIKPQVERIARKQYNNEQTPQLIESRKN